jgi:hypothetical protein
MTPVILQSSPLIHLEIREQNWLLKTQVMEKALTIYNKNARARTGGFNAQVLQEIPLYLVVYLFCFWLLSMFFNFIFSSNIDFICKSAEVRIPNTQLILTIFKHNTLQT